MQLKIEPLPGESIVFEDGVHGSKPMVFVVTNQAVHELRHKRHAPRLHAEVRKILSPGGVFVLSDHFAGDGGLSNDQLYMTVAEQRAALVEAGFSNVEEIAIAGSLAMHRAT